MKEIFIIKKDDVNSKEKIKKQDCIALDYIFWEKYIFELNKKICNLGWDYAWENEHSRRGDLLKALIEQLKENQYASIEVSIPENKRVDLVIYDNKEINELWELKNCLNFFNLAEPDFNKTKKSLNVRYENSIKQTRNYRRIIKEQLKKQVKNCVIIYISKVSFVSSGGIKINNIKKLKEIHKKYSENNKIKIEDNHLSGFISIDPKLISERNFKAEQSSPFFKANGGRTQKMQTKLFAGIFIHVQKV